MEEASNLVSPVPNPTQNSTRTETEDVVMNDKPSATDNTELEHLIKSPPRTKKVEDGQDTETQDAEMEEDEGVLLSLGMLLVSETLLCG